MTVCRMCMCVCVWVLEVGYEAVEVALVYWRVLSSVSEGPFGYSLLRQSFGEGAHSNRTWLLGGVGGATALQTYSPAGGGYLGHLVHSSGWPIPSTTTANTHGEGHIWPYLCCPATLTGKTTEEEKPLTESVGKSQNWWQHLNVYTGKSWNWIL